jgi:hypothetical protein
MKAKKAVSFFDDRRPLTCCREDRNDPCHPEERSDEGSAFPTVRKTEILRFAQDDKRGGKECE